MSEVSTGRSCGSTGKRSVDSELSGSYDPDEIYDISDLRYYRRYIDYALPLPKKTKKSRLDTCSGESATRSSPDNTSCGCKSSCISNRCRCHKYGNVCSSSCKCSDCKNPFNRLEVMAEFGVDVDKCKEDPCLMQFMTTVTDERLRKLLDTDTELYCCNTTVKLHRCIPGLIRCPGDECDEVYAYSWCDYEMREISNAEARNHCRKCRDCVGRCAVHCNKCGRCFWLKCLCYSDSESD